METPNKIEYPEAHPRAKEIRAKQEAINNLFSEFGNLLKKAREDYHQAHEFLRQMGQAQLDGQNKLKACADGMKELEAIITAPTI